MNKKPVPGLMGDAKFLSGCSIQEVHVGARRITRIVQPGDSDLSRRFHDADSLFGGGFGDLGVFELQQMLQKAGFPEYPATVTPSEREKIAERFTGAAPNIEDPEDIQASLAWVLVRFSEAEFSRQSYISESNFGGVWFTGIRMGRLAEWWVWRSEGYDRRAAGKGESEGALQKAREARARNQEFAADWHEEAKKMAQEMRARNSKRSRWNIANELARKFERSPRRVADIIKTVIP